MGGFFLRGPTHTFSNSISTNCRCPSFKAEIDEITENRLLRKRVFRLYVSRDLPQHIREQIKNKRPHLGTDKGYVFERNDFDPQAEIQSMVRSDANEVMTDLHRSFELAQARRVVEINWDSDD